MAECALCAYGSAAAKSKLATNGVSDWKQNLNYSTPVNRSTVNNNYLRSKLFIGGVPLEFRPHEEKQCIKNKNYQKRPALEVAKKQRHSATAKFKIDEKPVRL